MGKKKRIKRTVYGSIEGDREEAFLKVLIEIYRTIENNINPTFKNSSGGSPDRIVGFATRNSDRHKAFAWLDEDFEPSVVLSKEVREDLARCWNHTAPEDDFFQCSMKDLQKKYNQDNRKPVLIVSRPICVEALIIRTLGHTCPHEVESFLKKMNGVRVRSTKTIPLKTKTTAHVHIPSEEMTPELMQFLEDGAKGELKLEPTDASNTTFFIKKGGEILAKAQLKKAEHALAEFPGKDSKEICRAYLCELERLVNDCLAQFSRKSGTS